MSGDKGSGAGPIAVVVSGDPARATSISRALGQAGLEARLFPSAERAFEALGGWFASPTERSEALPAVVVTDLFLPDIDGMGLCRLLRGTGWAGLDAVPLVIAFDGPFCGGQEFGLDGVTVLPLEGGDFAGRIRAIVQEARRESGLAALILAARKADAARLKETLEARGYRVDVVTTAPAARKAIARHPYAVAILNGHLAGAAPVVETLRGQYPDTVCLITTTDPTPEKTFEWMKTGADAVAGQALDADSAVELCANLRRANCLRLLQELFDVQASEARQRETLLNQSEAISHTGSWALDLASDRLTWSDETYRICGVRPQSFPPTYDAFLEFIHPDDRALVDQVYRRSVAEKRPVYEIEHRIVHKDTGEVRYVQEKCLHEQDASGAIIRSIGMVQDITDQKRAAEALAESEANLAAVINASPESAFLVDTEGMILACNRVAAERLGQTPCDLIGQCIYDQIPPAVASSRRQWVEKVISTGDPADFEDVRDGRAFSHHVRPVRDHEGRVRRVAIFGHDISAYRTAVEALQRQNDLLGAIRKAQNLFISGIDPREVYQEMLHILVETTGSEYGFLDEVLHDPDGTPYKLSLAMSDISWDEDSRRLYQDLAARNLEFRDLSNLGGAPITEGRTIIANDAAHDPHYRGTPAGHPPLKSYLGIPLRLGEEIIGVAGVANREGGYTAEIVDFIQPLVQACAAMIWAGRALRRDQENLRAVQQSEEKYRQIAEMANEGIWAMDAQYHTTYVNRRMAEMLGYQVEEILGRPVDQFMFEEDLGDHSARMAERRKGQGGSYERRFRHKDGRAVWTYVSSTALRDDQGRFAGSFGMFTDITERKRAEEALREERWRLQSIVESTRVGTWEWNVQTGELTLNETWAQILGFTLGELAPVSVHTWESLTCPEDLEQAKDRLERHFSGELPYYECQLRMKHREGHWVWVLDRGRVVTWTSDGKPLLMFGTHTDISEYKRVEEAAIAGHARLLAIFDTIDEPVYVADPETYELLYTNRAMQDLFGPPSGGKCHEYLQHRDAPCPFCTNAEILGENEGCSSTWEFQNEVTGRWYRCIDKAIPWPDGRKVRYEMAIDITERKQSEEALLSSETWHRAVLQTAMDGFWASDSEGRFVEVNQTYCAMTGYTEDELLTMSIADIEAVESPEDIAQHIEQIRNAGFDRFETRHRCKDGRALDVEISAQYLPSHGGRVVVFVRDITQAMQQEEALRLQALVLDQIQDQVTVTDLNGVITFVNQAQEKRLGYTKEMLLGHPTSVFGEDADQGATQREIVEKTLRDGSWRGEVVNYTVDGAERILDCRTQVVRGKSGEPIALCGVATDVTDSKQAERALRESEARNSAILNALPDMMFALDRDGVFLDYHAPEGAPLIAPPEVFLGRGVDEVFNSDMAALTMLHIREALEIGESAPYVYDALLDGEQRFFEARMVAQTATTVLTIVRDVTDQRRSEEALRESEEKHRRLFETMAQGVVYQAADGRILSANPAAERILGHRLDDLRGRTSQDTVWKTIREDGSALPGDEHPAMVALRTGKPVEQFVLGVANGETNARTWMSVTAIPLFRPGEEKPFQVYATLEDITAQREAESNYRMLFHEMLDGFALHEVICDASGTPVNYRYLAVNPAFERMVGIKAEDIAGKTVLEILPGTESYWIETYGKVAMTGEPISFEHFHSGLQKSFEVTAFRPAANQFACIFVDITDRKRAEEELRRRESLLERIFEIMPVGLWFADHNGMLLRGNPAGVRIWGAEPHVPLGEYGVFKARRLPSGQEIGPDDWALAHTVREGVTITGELLEIEAFDGKKKVILNYSAPVLDEQGRVDGAIVVNQDITELNRLQDQLAQAQKMESVGRLAGGVAHDFNNMLGVILGHAEMALEQIAPSEPTFNDLREIKKAAERSAELTRQLLGFARRQTIAPKVLDLNETVESMLKMLRRLIGEDIELLWQPGPNLWPVNMDASQLDQILANLCVNARDAIDGVGRVSIETSNAAFDEAYCAEHPGYSPGEYSLLSVSDNGCGMGRDTLDKLFEPFFTTKALGKGTGLGLATVYGIVKQNNGFINVYSEVGQGTTFKIYLPRHKGKAGRVREAGPQAPAARGHEIILLVEDETAILQLGKKLLERLGYTVLAASTPGEAMRLAREHGGEIDLLMTDVIMPEMNGRELAKNLLTLYPSMKRLFTSGYTADIIAHHGVLEPGVHFLQKPYSVTSLATILRKALDGEGGGA